VREHDQHHDEGDRDEPDDGCCTRNQARERVRVIGRGRLWRPLALERPLSVARSVGYDLDLCDFDWWLGTAGDGDGFVSLGAKPIAFGRYRVPKLQRPITLAGQTFALGLVLGVLLEQTVALGARLITRLEQVGTLSQQSAALSGERVALDLRAVL
jgi:hypothetical protein